jgi:hypothetical protein
MAISSMTSPSRWRSTKPTFRIDGTVRCADLLPAITDLYGWALR